MEAGGVAESESFLGLALCDFLSLLLPLLLAAAAAVFAIGIERWLLLLITYAGAAGSESEITDPLCAKQCFVFFSLDKPAAVLAIGVQRWLLILMPPPLMMSLSITYYLLRDKYPFFPPCAMTSRRPAS